MDNLRQSEIEDWRMIDILISLHSYRRIVAILKCTIASDRCPILAQAYQACHPIGVGKLKALQSIKVISMPFLRFDLRS